MLLAINACPIMHEPGIRPPKAPFGINSVWALQRQPTARLTPMRHVTVCQPSQRKSRAVAQGQGLCFPQFDAEHRSPAHLRAFHKDLAFVILLDNSLCQRQSQAPAPFLGCETGGKNALQVFLPYALACVMHFNDNHGSWDDDMIVSSVHMTTYVELLFWLKRTNYKGWLSMDQYPYREDAIDAISESLYWVKKYEEIVEEYYTEIEELIQANDAVATSRFLRRLVK